MKKLKAILLIDDDSIFTWLTRSMLIQMDVADRIDCLSNAEIAIDYFTKLASSEEGLAKECPELIFLDIAMPGASGFDFLEMLKQIPGCEEVASRVVILTASMLTMDIQKSMNYGIMAYFVKPLTETKVSQLIQGIRQPIQL